MTASVADQRYLDLLLSPLDECTHYQPKFGTESEGVTLDQFRNLYGQDPFYHWVGLDSDLMYAAHKAAGGMTSIYRQLGAGCDSLFRAVILDALHLSDEQVSWSYEITKDDGQPATLTLDARIDVTDLAGDHVAQGKLTDWLARCGQHLLLAPERISQLRGAVFEARQGYKSADSKRQNADLRFGLNAANQNYLPVLSIVSTQASQSVLRRYRNARMLVMIGTLSGDDVTSTFAFFRNVVGYDLQALFDRNTSVMRRRCQAVLQQLLTAS